MTKKQNLMRRSIGSIMIVLDSDFEVLQELAAEVGVAIVHDQHDLSCMWGFKRACNGGA